MLLNILEVLESHSVFSLSVISIALMVFIPQGLHLMDIKFLSVFVTTEDAHNFLSFLNIVDFELIFGIHCIKTSIMFIQSSSGFNKCGSLDSISTELVDLGFDCIKFNCGWRLCNSFVNIFKSLINLTNFHIVLT